jgi:hypothetical protein
MLIDYIQLLRDLHFVFKTLLLSPNKLLQLFCGSNALYHVELMGVFFSPSPVSELKNRAPDTIYTYN